MIVLYHKPYRMLSQYNVNPDMPDQRVLPPELAALQVAPIGRLDYDSEGLLLLTDQPQLERALLAPERQCPKTYLVQVQGTPTDDTLAPLRDGTLTIRVGKKPHHCAPANASILPQPPTTLWPRHPAVDPHSPTSWLTLTLTEGKNRQIRRMTAKLGYPTLRLIRQRIDTYTLEDLAPGEWRQVACKSPHKRL